MCVDFFAARMYNFVTKQNDGAAQTVAPRVEKLIYYTTTPLFCQEPQEVTLFGKLVVYNT